MVFFQHCLICRPLDSTVSEDAGIGPRTVATFALAVRRSNHLAIDLIHILIVILLPIGLAGPVLENSSQVRYQKGYKKNLSMLYFFQVKNSKAAIGVEGARNTLFCVFMSLKRWVRAARPKPTRHKYLTNKAALERFILYTVCKVYIKEWLGMYGCTYLPRLKVHTDTACLFGKEGGRGRKDL